MRLKNDHYNNLQPGTTMKTKTFQILILSLILASFLLGACFYPIMPERMASHWDPNGSVNGYMPKLVGLFLMPVISIIIFLAFLVIPRIDPLKGNIEKFRSYFNLFILLLFGFLSYLYLLTDTLEPRLQVQYHPAHGASHRSDNLLRRSSDRERQAELVHWR